MYAQSVSVQQYSSIGQANDRPSPYTTSSYTSSNYDDPPSTNSSNAWGLSQQLRNPADVPTAVQALLIETKQLLDSLRKWSVGQSTETDVSDVYVRLGTDFNKATRAFGYFGIDMTDLQGVPENLRGVLEQCLGEDQTPQTLAVFMPEVRQILYTLLQGLQARQPLWKTASRTAPYRS